MNTTYILLSTTEESIVDKVNKASSEATPEAFSTTNNVLQLLGLVLLLIVILIAAYYTSKFVGRYKMGQLKDSNIQVIEAYRISTNKMLQIVKISNKYVVIGISKDNITYITELDESQVLTHEIKEGEKQSFRQIFEKIKGKKE
ncbi:MAG: flagellar biosynthetic protein FliO [Clostridiales bacterium]|jgi:flagellar protein FliO/FliZ|nr:flagellar biosynthetic protein FliO [Clostridiales bacterium]